MLLMLLVLLFPLATPVSASPGIISNPSFETEGSWTYSESDLKFVDGTQSTTWKTQGTCSYLLSADGTENIGADSYARVTQSVDFTTLDTLSFDADLHAATDGYYEARVIVGTTTVWFQACTTTETEYLHQEIDVSEYTNSQDLIFQVYTVVKAKNIAMNTYYDNIKTWGSFNDLAHTIVNNNFDTTAEDTVYTYGENFDASTAYHIGYYDGDTVLVVSEGQTSTSGGELSGQCYFPTYQETAVPGTWHTVVYDDSVASPPSNYTADDPNSVVEDSFEVAASAIPEFPAVIAAIVVAGLCFGIYFWMRRRRLAYVKA